MKTKAIIFVVTTFLVAFLFSFWYTHSYESKPSYSPVDSAKIDSLEKREVIHLREIDSLEKSRKTRIVKIIKYKYIADSLELDADIICLPVINAKNKQIAELDSTCKELDQEAESYSKLLLIADERKEIEIKRFEALSFKMDSTIVSYQDSLNSVNKRLYSGFFKRNHLWNKNQFRKYVMEKQPSE